MMNNLYCLDTNYTLRVKRANKIRRLRIKRAFTPLGAIGGIAGGGYGAYKGVQLANSYADRWIGKNNNSWWAPWARGAMLVGGGLLGGVAGAGLGYAAGSGLGWLAPKLGFMGTSMVGTQAAKPTMAGAQQMNKTINNYTRGVGTGGALSHAAASDRFAGLPLS